MNEAGRLLRYVVPGVLFEAVLVGWLLVDTQVSGLVDFNWTKDHQEGLVAVLIGATVPVGFLVGVVTNEILWRIERPRTTAYGRIGDVSHLPPVDVQTMKESLQAFRDVDIELLKGVDGAGARMRGLLDLMNGLANAATAVLLGIIVATLVFAGHVTSLFSNQRSLPREIDGFRVALLVSAWLLTLATWLLFDRAEKRVRRISTYGFHYLMALQRPAMK